MQSALARIRRAQEKGKREVKLNQDELDALEKRRKRMQAASTASKERKGSASSGGSGSERRRRSDRYLTTVPAGEPSSRKRAKSMRRDELVSSAGNPPGMLLEGPDGLTYAPLGYYPPQAGSNRNSPTRPRSATSQQFRGPPRNSDQEPAVTSLKAIDQSLPQAPAQDVLCQTKKTGSLLDAAQALLNLTALTPLNIKSRRTPHHQFHKSTNRALNNQVVESPLVLLKSSTLPSDVILQRIFRILLQPGLRNLI